MLILCARVCESSTSGKRFAEATPDKFDPNTRSVGRYAIEETITSLTSGTIAACLPRTKAVSLKVAWPNLTMERPLSITMKAELKLIAYQSKRETVNHSGLSLVRGI